MQSVKYLNAVLTVIAVLLTLHLWAWQASPGSAPQAFDIATPAYAGIPNAGEQRQQMVDEIKKLSSKVDALINLFRSGQARVKTTESNGK